MIHSKRLWRAEGIGAFGGISKLALAGGLLSALIVVPAMLFIFWDGLVAMVGAWSSDEYSHGYLIPIIAVLMVWQNWQDISKERNTSGAWVGTGLVIVGLIVFLMGELGTLYVIVQYAFLKS